jgi:gamma-glutamylcyclotransferase (GGCT)/AIG2-like uncharacterized protein YtfP
VQERVALVHDPDGLQGQVLRVPCADPDDVDPAHAVHPREVENLFSYGTLQLPDVQRATFGRLLEGRADAVVGYALHQLTITDPHVLATSGAAVHPVLRPGDGAVEGTVFAITADELAAADAYEVDDYQRVRVPLRSGGQAWVYVFAE